MNKLRDLLEILEKSLTGARALDDTAAALQISRAIAALESPPEMEIFTEDFKTWYIEHSTGAAEVGERTFTQK